MPHHITSFREQNLHFRVWSKLYQSSLYKLYKLSFYNNIIIYWYFQMCLWLKSKMWWTTLVQSMNVAKNFANILIQLQQLEQSVSSLTIGPCYLWLKKNKMPEYLWHLKIFLKKNTRGHRCPIVGSQLCARGSSAWCAVVLPTVFFVKNVQFSCVLPHGSVCGWSKCPVILLWYHFLRRCACTECYTVIH